MKFLFLMINNNYKQNYYYKILNNYSNIQFIKLKRKNIFNNHKINYYNLVIFHLGNLYEIILINLIVRKKFYFLRNLNLFSWKFS